MSNIKTTDIFHFHSIKYVQCTTDTKLHIHIKYFEFERWNNNVSRSTHKVLSVVPDKNGCLLACGENKSYKATENSIEVICPD